MKLIKDNSNYLKYLKINTHQIWTYVIHAALIILFNIEKFDTFIFEHRCVNLQKRSRKIHTLSNSKFLDNGKFAKH